MQRGRTQYNFSMKPHVFLMLGAPGSGKTHFAKTLAEKTSAIRFNSDFIRQHLFDNPADHHTRQDHLDILRMVNCAAVPVLQAGHSVIYDLNNNFAEDRFNIASNAQLIGIPTVVVWVKTPIIVAIERGTTRTLSKEHIRVSPQHIERVAAEIEAPGKTEFCIEIDGMIEPDDQHNQFLQQFRQLRLHN